ncbi:transposase [Streptomyces mirabilis]|uniref:transposase n=1 Tax=Streptomyces mirabilis TaxID=68239 RepID=UPI0036546A47
MGTYKYSAEFRADAVALPRSSGRPVSRVAAELGVNHETLRQWIKVADEAAWPEAVAESAKDAEIADGLRESVSWTSSSECQWRSLSDLVIGTDGWCSPVADVSDERPGHSHADCYRGCRVQDRRQYVWNNDHDAAILRNDNGRLVDEESWGHGRHHHGDARR